MVADQALIKLISFVSRVIRHPVAKYNVSANVGIPVLNDLVIVSRYSRGYCFQVIGLLRANVPHHIFTLSVSADPLNPVSFLQSSSVASSVPMF
jgi:hypothetical protein